MYPVYWYVFFACLVKYVGECLVCVMYVCRWLYCSEGVFFVLCEFVTVCLPVVSVRSSILLYCVFVVGLYC